MDIKFFFLKEMTVKGTVLSVNEDFFLIIFLIINNSQCDFPTGSCAL